MAQKVKSFRLVKNFFGHSKTVLYHLKFLHLVKLMYCNAKKLEQTYETNLFILDYDLYYF